MNSVTWPRVALCLLVMGMLLSCFAGSFDRRLVAMPAWRQLGAGAWAAFSRLADLGNGGYLYSVTGIGGTVLMLGAALAFRMSPRRPLSVAIPIYGTVVMFLCVLLVTTQAAPIMLSLRRIGDDPVVLRKAFEGFYEWDAIRAIFVALGCCLKVVGLGCDPFCRTDQAAGKQGQRTKLKPVGHRGDLSQSLCQLADVCGQTLQESS
jgi:hypothetical protein